MALFAVFGHFEGLGLGPWLEDVVWVWVLRVAGSGSWAFVSFGRFWPFLAILGPFSYFLVRGRFYLGSGPLSFLWPLDSRHGLCPNSPFIGSNFLEIDYGTENL